MEFKIIPSEQTPAVPELEGSVTAFVQQHKDELEAFLKFAGQQYNAVGLAANQCSLDGERWMQRVFALKEDDVFMSTFKLIVNPKITEYIGFKVLRHEGCLTWGSEKKIIAERNIAVRVSYHCEGRFIENELHTGFQAQVWQHECDHLNGVRQNVHYEILLKKPKFVMPTRNSPCPCASGKKFKHCCLNYF